VRAWLPEAAALSVADVQRLTAGTGDGASEVPAETLLALARRVLDDFAAARAREGARLVELLHARITELRTLATRAEPLVPQAVQRKAALHRPLERGAGRRRQHRPHGGGAGARLVRGRRLRHPHRCGRGTGAPARPPGRDRIGAGKGGEAGKRLDFLIQELHREANTLGSKSTALELSRISVDMKVLIEQMREQVQNLE
jgi:uncharacterized protein YicC (UPF0701 family)